MALELFFGLATLGLLGSVLVKLNRLQAEIERLQARLTAGRSGPPQ
ncbi:MAG TPA: hypothetical protein P5024_01800 [Burkholderiaceae bacterium]|jgi:hypothetical protein|nr:hypothetical protein [Burkholderiaceae bacterium]HPE01182.1 hypothetical protein [Burkholderiaceae bacterium]HRZ00266.1 hypothetical protein [Burkholderiaceae bacterium]